MPEPFFMELGSYIGGSVRISTAYFINPSHQSACLYVYPPIGAGQWLCNHVPAAMNTFNNRRTVEGANFSCGSYFI
jgi:hypothetical protein